MADEHKKLPDVPEAPQKGVESTKVTDTAAEGDQTAKFKELRQKLLKTELVFSFSSIPGPSSGSKFELTDGNARVAAATVVKEVKPETQDKKSASPEAKAKTESAAVADKAKANGASPAAEAPAKSKPVDMNEATRDAEAIRKATGNDNYVARWADKDGINKILEGKTEAERKAIDQVYQQKYGHGLEQEMRAFEKGSDLDKFLNVFKRSDNNAENQAARRVHEDLLEDKNWVKGRSATEIEKDVRDLLSTRNSAQIGQMDQEYKKTYGVSLKDAIAADSQISQASKDMAAIYLKGNDQRTDKDTSQLISIALKNQNGELFAESMRDASPTARKAFLDANGEDRVGLAFGHWYSNKDVQHAMDYARDGKLSAATQVRDNTGIAFDNAKGVELAINRMTDGERKLYGDGKALAEGKPVAGLSDQDQKKSRDYYTDLHGALSKTANATEMIKYEDMIANKGDGSLVASLAKHRGKLWNDSSADIVGDIRNMTPAQFDDGKAHPERRQELQEMLKSLNKNPEESNQALTVYDKMMAAPDLDHAREAAKPSVEQEVAASQHWYGADGTRISDSIANMSQADQQKYRSDEKFRNQLNQEVEKSIDDPRLLDAAQRMLQQVKDGKEPNSDLIAKIERIQNDDGSKTGEAAREIEKSFRQDPALRERVINPKTDEERKFSELFKKTAQETFGDDYDNIGKPLVEQGRLPLESKVGLNQGVFSNDYKSAFEDLQHATPEEKQRLKNDPEYRQTVLGFMDKNRQAIALATLDQTELKPEENIRAAVVGWGGSSDIVDNLKQIKPEQLDQAKADYARKYGTSLEGDLMAKLSGQDKDTAERLLSQNLNLEERANIARNQTEDARSGFGAGMSDNVFRSGTGAQADDAQNQTDRALSEKSKSEIAIASGNYILSNMTPQQIQEAQKRMSDQVAQSINFQTEATENHVDSKKAAAGYVADAAIMTVAVGSMIVTGGADTPLIIGLAVAGAGIKVGTNAALEGNNYDLSIGQVAMDAGIGSVTAATAAIGPGEIAAVFGIGRTAATEGARLAVTEAGEQVLARGGREVLEDGTKNIVRDALASGAKKLDQADFTALANKVVAPELTGAAREQAVKQLSVSLEKNVSEQMASGVVRQFTQHGLNAGGGALAGGASGIAQGTTEWDSRKSVAENLAEIAARGGESALAGAVAGGLSSVGSSSLGRAWQAARGVNEGENVAAADAARTTARPGERPPAEIERAGTKPAGIESPGTKPGAIESPDTKPAAIESPGTKPAALERPGSKPADGSADRPVEGTKPADRPSGGTTDGSTEGSKPLDQKWPTNEKGQILDSKGNILEHDWPKIEPNKVEAVRAQVREELGQVKAAGGMSVLEKLDNSGMSDVQKTQVLDALGEVREHYARTFKTDVDQPVNWIHTQGELGRVIDAAKAAGLTPAQTEDAMLASMFSDSLKTKANFTTHHLDGELAAEHVLKDKLGGDFTAERLNGIMHAIREHQIAPPAFMAMIYGGAIRRSIGAEGRALTEEENGAIKTLLGKMSDPFHQKLVDAPGGGKMLDLNDGERALLKRTGTDEWDVPSEGTAWNKMSRALIDGDGIDNYATAGGLSKIVQIRGPETGPFFKDGNFRYENPGRKPGSPPSSSQESWRDSFGDFAKVASPDGLKVAQSAADDGERAAVDAQARVDAWLHERLGIPANQELPTIPGWTGTPKLDAAGHRMIDPSGRVIMQPDNLKYPAYEQKWWDIHATPAAKRTAEDQAWYDAPANRYKGLTEQEIKDFNFAKEIRNKYVDELRKEQRVAGDVAPDYQPVVKAEAAP